MISKAFIGKHLTFRGPILSTLVQLKPIFYYSVSVQTAIVDHWYTMLVKCSKTCWVLTLNCCTILSSILKQKKFHVCK